MTTNPVRQFLVIALSLIVLTLQAVLPTEITPALAQGSQVYNNDFQGGVGPEWSNTATDTTPAGGRRFLGQFSNGTVTLTLNNLPAHTEATLTFDFFAINSWDGNHRDDRGGPDTFDVRVSGGPTLLHHTFSNLDEMNRPQSYPNGGDNPAYSGATERDSLGYSYYGSAVYHFSFAFAHSGSSLQIRFSGLNLDPELRDESWGLDNVTVSVAGGGGGGSGGGSGNTGGSNTGGGSPQGPAGYTFCANEGQRCNFSGVADVAYGANGQFSYKSEVSNGIDCGNGVFGDPAPGTAKACFYKPAGGGSGGGGQPKPCPSGTGPGGITAGSYDPNKLTQAQKDWLWVAFGHGNEAPHAPVGYGGESCGQGRSYPPACYSGQKGPGGIVPDSYPPTQLSQAQRQWLYNQFGHQGTAPVGYGGEECPGDNTVPTSTEPPAPVSDPRSSGSPTLEATGTVKVRSGPSTQCAELGTISPGTKYKVEGRNNNSTWLMFNFNGQSGWVLASLTRITNSNQMSGIPQVANQGCQGQGQGIGGSSGQGSGSGSTSNPINISPNDRLAASCDISSGTVTVYGKSRNGETLSLASFKYPDIFNAGLIGLQKETINGRVSIRVDSQNNFRLTWSSVRHGANGQGDFAKDFNCAFPMPAPRPGFAWISKEIFDGLMATYSASITDWKNSLKWQEQVKQFTYQQAVVGLGECLLKQIAGAKPASLASAIVSAAINFGFGSTADTKRKIKLYEDHQRALQIWSKTPGYRWGDFIQVPISLTDVPQVSNPQFFNDWKLLIPACILP